MPTDLLEWLLGDPTVVLFEQEDELHMFVNEVRQLVTRDR